MLKSSQGIRSFASSNDSVLENTGLKIALNAGEEKTNKTGKLTIFGQSNTGKTHSECLFK